MTQDIIAAIATPIGTGGISIIRISGYGSIDLISSFVNVDNISANQLVLRQFKYNDIVLDKVMIVKFVGAKSFTGEETVEVHCHGGVYLTNKLLKIIIKSGARLATPGEYSKRAFLNGKLDLIQAQGIIDIIEAQTENALKMAQNSTFGVTTKLLDSIYQELLTIVTTLAVKIDYPEYDDIENYEAQEFSLKLTNIKNKIDEVIYESKRGQFVKNGIKTAILGAPNVGKSTLLNLLAKENRAIVTDIAGTTRDTIEVEVTLGNLKLNLVDTAGLRDTQDIVEKLGLEKSYHMLSSPELCIIVLDGTRPLNQTEIDLIEDTKNLKRIILSNKNDINYIPLNLNEMSVNFHDENYLKIIEAEILKVLDLQSFDVMSSNYVTNINEIVTLEEVTCLIAEMLSDIEYNFIADLIELDLKEIIFSIGSLIGYEVKNDLLNEMFGRFCLGK